MNIKWWNYIFWFYLQIYTLYAEFSKLMVTGLLLLNLSLNKMALFVFNTLRSSLLCFTILLYFTNLCSLLIYCSITCIYFIELYFSYRCLVLPENVVNARLCIRSLDVVLYTKPNNNSYVVFVFFPCNLCFSIILFLYHVLNCKYACK